MPTTDITEGAGQMRVIPVESPSKRVPGEEKRSQRERTKRVSRRAPEGALNQQNGSARKT
jgi:hypothetical protein